MKGSAATAPGPGREEPFEFSGSLLCLDFANTLERRSTGHPVEHLGAWPDLVRWGREAGIFSAAQARQALRGAADKPARARRALHRALALREAIFRAFSAVVRGARPRPADLRLVGAAAGEGYRDSEIVPGERAFAWRWKGTPSDAARLLWEVSRSAVDLLTSGDLRRLRVCAAEDCDWLFMDRSRNRTRRWCDMTACGNRSKARRHYQRQRSAG